MFVECLSASHFNQFPFFIQNIRHKSIFAKASNPIRVFRHTSIRYCHERWSHQNWLKENLKLTSFYENIQYNFLNCSTNLEFLNRPTGSSNWYVNKCRILISDINTIDFGRVFQLQNNVHRFQSSFLTLPFFIRIRNEICSRMMLLHKEKIWLWNYLPL